MDGSTMSTSHKTVRAAPFFARIYEFAVDRLQPAAAKALSGDAAGSSAESEHHIRRCQTAPVFEHCPPPRTWVALAK
jgi:hypothetical protein